MLDSVCLPLQPFLRNVLSAKIGICAREIELVEVSTGKPASEKYNIAVNDRFKLKIPVADQYMTWQIIFNGSFPNCPPDFDIGDYDFYSISLESLEEALPTLCSWDCRNEKSLVKVLSELHSAYLKYQVKELETIDNRCAYEYSSLISEGKIMPDQVEVYVDRDAVHFLIKLNVDLSAILPSPDPDEFVLLAVRFGAHGSVRSANLITSPNIQQLLDSTFDLPHNITGDESLFEYVDEVVRSVESQIISVISQRKEKRKRFVFEMLRCLGRSVISFDALEYHNASFLLQHDGFVCILEVTLTTLFPHVQPSYRLLSSYCSSAVDVPFSQKVPLPYEKWDIPVTVRNSITILLNKKLPDFQKYTIPTFKLPN